MEGMEQKRGALESDCNLPASKITVLINIIAKMAKNPSIECELSQVLDDFLEKLGECDKYLENGVFNMNFAEAALLIQCSADLYSKKVDILWDCIFDYQKRLLLTEEKDGDKNRELEKVEERKRKYKRKRKTNSEENESAKLVNSFSFGNSENIDYLKQHYETIDMTKQWDKFQVKRMCDSTNEQGICKNFTFLPSNSIHTEDNDYIGKYDQFHSMSVLDEMFHLEKQKLLFDDHNCITKMRIDSYVINDFFMKKCIPSNQKRDSYSLELKQYVAHFFESHQYREKEVTSSRTQQCCFTQLDKLPMDILQEKSRLFGNDSTSEEIFLKPCSSQTPETRLQLTCKDSFVSLERLPFNVIRDKLRRSSFADSLFDEDHMSVSCLSPCNLDQTIGGNLENRSKSCSQDSAFYEDLDDHGNDTECQDSMVESSSKVEDSAIAITEFLSQKVEDSTMTPVEELGRVGEPVTTEGAGEVKTTTTDEANFSEQETLSEAPVTEKPAKRSLAVLLLQDEENQESKKRKLRKKRISAKAIKLLATGLTVANRDFERFCRQQYKPAEGEGKLCPLLHDWEQSDQEEDNQNETSDEEQEEENETGHASPPHSDEEEEEEKNDEIPPNPEIESQNVLPLSLSPIPLLDGPSTSANFDLLGRTSTPHRPKDTPFSLSNTDPEQEERSRRNVREWRSFIIPKLKSLDNRADFDIHEYGSRMVEPATIGEEKNFKDIVKGKSKSEVVRYFIATLQLANTYNVEISGAVPNQISNDTFKVKVIDKTKHHERLEEYQAPSEETLKERMERARVQTADMPPPNKKRKTEGCPRRLF